MKKAVLVLVAVLVMFIISGCATQFTTTNGMLAYGDVKGSEVGEFMGEERAGYILHPSLISLKAPNEELETIIDPALAEIGASAAKDLTVTYEMDIVALLVNSITCGLYGMPYVRVEGTGVK